jgi:hypothetical protein
VFDTVFIALSTLFDTLRIAVLRALVTGFVAVFAEGRGTALGIVGELDPSPDLNVVTAAIIIKTMSIPTIIKELYCFKISCHVE